MVNLKIKEKGSVKSWKKVLIRLSLIMFILIVVLILFISPLTKYFVEKYGVKYTGREIKMNWAFVNPITGYIHFSNLKIYEPNSDSVFLSISGLSADISLLKLVNNTIEISSLLLDNPIGVIEKDSTHLNIDDLIERFSSGKDPNSNKVPIRLNILNIKINDGEFTYLEPLIPINYSIRKVNFESTGLFWNRDSIIGKFSLLPGIGSGDIKGDFMINRENMDYRLFTVAHKLDLNIIEQYLKDLASYGNFSANIDLDIKSKGNLNDREKININGKLAVNDFHFGKNKNDDYAYFKKLEVAIKELNPADKKYLFDSVMLLSPYFKYERYDQLDNVQRMFGKNGENVSAVMSNSGKFNLIIEIADYIKIVFKNFLRSDYNINSLIVENGNLKFIDYSICEKFTAALDPFHIKADSVNNKRERVEVIMNSGIKPYGTVSASVSMDPNDNRDFDFNYKLEKIPASIFNPYLVSYTSFPLDRGDIEMHGKWKVRNDIIESTNHFIIIDARVTKRIRKKDTHWLPMPLIMAFIRERGNVIDYEIPITGDLKNPKFHLHDALKDLIENIFIKPSSTLYRMEVKNLENEIEKLLSLNWTMRQFDLRDTQKEFIIKIADFLKENPQASISIHPFYYADKEKEYILFYEAKKKYYFAMENREEKSMTEDDSLLIENMSSKDLAFVKYLDKEESDSMLYTIQDKCYRFVGVSIVNDEFEKLVKKREHVLMEYFKMNETQDQVKISAKTDIIPFNGFSYFKIKYNGDMPGSLMDAYGKLNEKNIESPRDKYLKFRNGKS